MRIFIFGFIIVSLSITWYLTPHESIKYANKLVRHNNLYEFKLNEKELFKKTISELFRIHSIDKTIRINESYSNNSINIYVIDSLKTKNRFISHGGASYVYSSDIIFIDSSYFNVNGHAIFDDSEDQLVNELMLTFRVHTIFVLAHEIGHRQLKHNSFFNKLSSFTGHPHGNEKAADEYGIKSLLKLYESLVKKPGNPIQNSIYYMTEPTGLNLLSDHLSVSIGFISDEFLSGIYPVLSRSQTHPIFFSRMILLLDYLELKAKEINDIQSLQRIRMARDISSSTVNLINKKPVEIVFSNPVQYVFIDNNFLYYFENDESNFRKLPLDKLINGEIISIETEQPNKSATIRYAWTFSNSNVFILQREGIIKVLNKNQGTENVIEVKDSFGDYSCIPRIFIPPLPADTVFILSCSAGIKYISRIGSSGKFKRIKVSEIIQLAFPQGKQSNIKIHSVELTAALLPISVFSVEEQVYKFSFDQSLNSGTISKVDFPIDRLPEQAFYNGKKILPSIFITDNNNKSYHVEGNDIFREFGLFDIEKTDSTPAVSIDLTQSSNFPGLSQDLLIRRVEHLGNNRVLANIHATGAYLIDFNSMNIEPISRNELKNREQILSNRNGDWLLYQKYSTRALFFRQSQQ